MTLDLCLVTTALLLTTLVSSAQDLERASGVGFMGRGYDVIDGNPDGVALGSPPPPSASDPGIRTQPWLKLSYDSRRTDVEQRYLIPDQLSYQAENSCLNATSSSVITSNKKYQEKLSKSVSLSAGFGFGLFGKIAFTGGMSHSKETVTDIKSKKVYFDQTVVCSYGHANYRFGNEKKYLRLTDDTMRMVCKLPAHQSNLYYELIQRLGTHFISDAVLGLKEVHRKETVMSHFFESVMESSGVNSGVSASYGGTSGGVGVQVDSSQLSKNSESMFGQSELKWRIGSRQFNNPTKLKLQPISFLLDRKNGFWDVACAAEADKWGECCAKLDDIYKFMLEALETYGSVFRKMEPPSVLPLNFKLVWPEGTYTLHISQRACPKGHNFVWAIGRVFQDTDDWADDNRWNDGIGWSHDQLDSSSITQVFCTKGINNANGYELQWPRGDYCIHKYSACPRGFKEGFVKFDDEDYYNKNWQSGSLPTGEYGKDTKIHYCCRNDGTPLEPIRLPSTDPFYLVRRGTQCQRIHNMNVRRDWVQWSLESWWGIDASEMKGGDMHPYVTVEKEKLKMFFCHYTPIEVIEDETVTINIS